MNGIGLLGGGRHAMEVSEYAPAIAFVVVDGPYLETVRSEWPERVLAFEECTDREWKTPVIIGVGAPALRRDLALRWPGTHFGSAIAGSAYVSPRAKIGPGATVAPGSVVMPGVVMGSHALINIGATVSHDCVMGDFVTVSPGAHIGGNTKMGSGAFVGIGATISSNVNVGDGAVVGAGSVVVRDLEPFGIYVGVPARLVRRTTDWLEHV